MTCINVTPVTMARDALSAMTEEQRNAFAIQVLSETSDPHNVQQLRRAEFVSKVTADDLERRSEIEKAMRRPEGRGRSRPIERDRLSVPGDQA